MVFAKMDNNPPLSADELQIEFDRLKEIFLFSFLTFVEVPCVKRHGDKDRPLNLLLADRL